jgi:LacI family transcriptional regulator
LREVHEDVLESGVPAVVFGGVYPRTSALLSVDSDQAQIGYQLARYLLGRGRRRLALITRETWLPGDSLQHDGICRALGEEKAGCGSVMIRGIPPVGLDLAAETIAQLLRQPDRPTGLICHGPVFAKTALCVAAEMGLAVPKDLDIVFDHWTSRSEIGLPHTRPDVSYKEQAWLVGQLLRELINGRRPEQEHVVIGVQLVEEDGTRNESETREGRQGTVRTGKAEPTGAPPCNARRKRRRAVKLSSA